MYYQVVNPKETNLACVADGIRLVDVMDGFGFAVWTTLSRGWAFVAAAFIIIIPLVQEIYAIHRQYR